MSLSKAILFGTLDTVRQALASGESVNVLDEYGYTPLIEAILAQDAKMINLLIEHGADVNYPDVTNQTPLFWATDLGDPALCQLLLKCGADPNQYPLSRQSPLVYPFLRDDHVIKDMLCEAGADLEFAKDYINAKLLAHRYSLPGHCEIVDPKGLLLEIDMEGFYLEFTLTLVQNSLIRYKRHYVARELKEYFDAFSKIIEALEVAAHLRRFKHFTIDLDKHNNQIYALLEHDLLIMPIAYEGHAITCLHYGNYFIKCDRGEHGKRFAPVVVYRIREPAAFHYDFIRDLIYGKHSYKTIHQDIEYTLGLEVVTELDLPVQVAGNCSWANVEACMPAALLLFWLDRNPNLASLDKAKTFILQLFHRWREWDKEVALSENIHDFHAIKPNENAKKAAKITLFSQLFCDALDPKDPKAVKVAEKILPILMEEEVRYILDSYIKIYCGASQNEACGRLRRLFTALDEDFPKILE